MAVPVITLDDLRRLKADTTQVGRITYQKALIDFMENGDLDGASSPRVATNTTTDILQEARNVCEMNRRAIARCEKDMEAALRAVEGTDDEELKKTMKTALESIRRANENNQGKLSQRSWWVRWFVCSS